MPDMEPKQEDFSKQFKSVWKQRPEIVWGSILVIGVAIYFIAPLFFTSTSTPTQPVPPTQPPPLTIITNPDYTSNPSAYIVDWTGKVPSQIPTGKALWVEQIVGPTKIKVSYTITQSGENIIELKSIVIPGLGWPKLDSSGKIPPLAWLDGKYPFVDGNCWSQQAQSFLSQNILHKVVYISPESELLMENGLNGNLINIAEFIVKSGYGVVPLNMDIDLSNSSLAGIGNSSKKELYNDQQVASLAKRGAWGTCGGS